MEHVTWRQKDGSIVRSIRYTKDEIRAHWALSLNSARSAALQERRPTGLVAVLVDSEARAVELAALWLRRICPLPTSHYLLSDYGSLFLDARAMGGPAQPLIDQLSRLIRAWEIDGVDEAGPLYAPPDCGVEMDAHALAEALDQVRNHLPPDQKVIADAALHRALLNGRLQR